MLGVLDHHDPLFIIGRINILDEQGFSQHLHFRTKADIKGTSVLNSNRSQTLLSPKVYKTGLLKLRHFGGKFANYYSLEV